MVLLISYSFLNLYLHNAHCRVLEAEWHDVVNSSLLPVVLNEAIELARQHQVTGWIADDRKIGPLKAADLAWVATNVLPALAEIGVQRLAMVQPEDLQNQQLIPEAYDGPVEAMPLELRRFTNLAEARAWACAV